MCNRIIERRLQMVKYKHGNVNGEIGRHRLADKNPEEKSFMMCDTDGNVSFIKETDVAHNLYCNEVTFTINQDGYNGTVVLRGIFASGSVSTTRTLVSHTINLEYTDPDTLSNVAVIANLVSFNISSSPASITLNIYNGSITLNKTFTVSTATDSYKIISAPERELLRALI